MASSTNKKIRALWNELENEMESTGSNGRIYRRLDLKQENGIRIGCMGPEIKWELLIEAGSESGGRETEFPEWKGMDFRQVSLDVPVPATTHIILSVESREHLEVFVAVCADLVDEIENISDTESRINVLRDWMQRWSRFFAKFGQGGLSAERQRGLFGELWFLSYLLENSVEDTLVLIAWKGWELGVHDFEEKGHALEVKTTLTKEPRRVQISSELQLDDTGLQSLHLLVLTLKQSGGGGETLPQAVDRLRSHFKNQPGCCASFEHAIREAGFIDAQGEKYSLSFSVKKKELFSVGEEFPRITEVPSGTGNLRYSVLVAACKPYECPFNDYLHMI